MKGARFYYGLLGVLSFLTSLALMAPAALVTGQLAQRLPGFSVQAVEGFAVEGSAQGVRWRGVRIERLDWTWRPLALFTGWLEFRLKINDPETTLEGDAAVGPSRRIRLQNIKGRLLLTELGILAGYPRLPLEGAVEFRLQELRLNPTGRPQRAEGVVEVLNMRALFNQPLALGDFTAQLRPADPEGVQGVVKDNNGPLALDSVFSLLPDGRYRLGGQAAIRDAENRALHQAMRLLGPPNSDGRWNLNLSGVLPL